MCVQEQGAAVVTTLQNGSSSTVSTIYKLMMGDGKEWRTHFVCSPRLSVGRNFVGAKHFIDFQSSPKFFNFIIFICVISMFVDFTT